MGHKDFGVRVEIPNEPETVTIEHDQWGRVEGVRLRGTNSWFKDGAFRHRADGWREVKPKKWVPVEVTIEGNVLRGVFDGYNSLFHLGKGYRWKTVEIEREEEG